jgi:hypothetical protein
MTMNNGMKYNMTFICGLGGIVFMLISCCTKMVAPRTIGRM